MRHTHHTWRMLLALFAVFLFAGASAKAMNKAELVDAIAKDAGLSKADAKRALENLSIATTKALKKGDRVALIGFGSFSISKRRAAGSCENVATVEFDFDLNLQPCRDPRCAACSIDDDDLVEASIADGTLGPDEAVRALQAMKNALASALLCDESVVIQGFGEFYVVVEVVVSQDSSAAVADTPASASGRQQGAGTGNESRIAAKKVAKFKAGAALAKAVN